MTSAPQPGRPRERRVDHAIADAVRTLLAERGYPSLTVDAVAARAGVGKAAIYRRYATKQEMTFSVLLHDAREPAPADTGSLKGDLLALTSQIADQLAESSAGVMAGLLADVYADPALSERFERTFLAVERSIVATLIDRAVVRGELSHRPDTAVVHVLLLGPMFAWLIMLDEDPARAPELAVIVAGLIHETLVSGTLSPGSQAGIADGGAG
ncbi:TetR/AcrR family transcriptional regulator [Jiangella alba]|uniref:DNA-binding transcriptional regulator, AcrR family n=1 Tax=Jiangella alba TaxID=561176 RepID=A0A1H5MLR5_9ACTN|nr:TetR/AcrR family transcriptional regulator [Jiangella alba]SEE90315.1 DNA-binding transcriptional regulator, AcrR family [Jiangella alba]